MSEKDMDGWKITNLEANALEALKSRLGFTNIEFCEFADFSHTSFSQIIKGKRNFNATLRQKLDAFLSLKLAALSEISDVQREELSSSVNYVLRRGAEHAPENYAYQPPGLYLPVGAPNYVERHAHFTIERALSDHSRTPSKDSFVKCVYVVGGVGTGKTSLLKRIPMIALNMGRLPIVGRLVEYFDGGEWPLERLSKGDIWNACGYALSGGHEEFKTNELDPAKPGFDRKFRSLLQRHLSRRPKAVRILEDFHELTIRADKLDDVRALLFTLFDQSERADDNLIILEDDGLAGSHRGVSQYVTRGAFVQCANIEPNCLYDLIGNVLGQLPAQRLILNMPVAVEHMLDAFGSCLFLHHVVLHKIRAIPEDQLENYKNISVLDEMIGEILVELKTPRAIDPAEDILARRLQTFSSSVLQRLRILSTFENSESLLVDLSTGNLARTPSMDVQRFLEWGGYIDRSGEVPEFVQQICAREVQ